VIDMTGNLCKMIKNSEKTTVRSRYGSGTAFAKI
jgi:hypothetical protein